MSYPSWSAEYCAGVDLMRRRWSGFFHNYAFNKFIIKPCFEVLAFEKLRNSDFFTEYSGHTGKFFSNNTGKGGAFKIGEALYNVAFTSLIT